MTKAPPKLYVNQFTGDIKKLGKSEARKLSEDWSLVDFVKNDKGEPVMRLKLANATVDVSENKPDEAATNGEQKSE